VAPTVAVGSGLNEAASHTNSRSVDEKDPKEPMPAEMMTCPHCHSGVSTAEIPAANDAWTCPHCGQIVPPQARQDSTGNFDRILAREFLRNPPRRSRRFVAGIVVGVMALMALLALVVGLSTVSSRRAHDLRPLGYLPEGTNVVGAVHVAKLMDEPTGRDFLAQFRLGPEGVDFEQFERWIGLPRDVLADLAFGLRVDERSVPRLTLVAQTLRSYTAADYVKSLQEPQPLERNQKKLYQFSIPEKGIRPVVWLAGERTFVFGLSPEDLDDVPLTPRSGVAHLPVPLQRFPGDLSAPRAQVWLIGHANHWEQTELWPRLASWLGEDQAVVNGVQTLGFWLTFDKSITVSAAAHCRDAAAAQSLDDYLRHHQVDEKGQLQSDPGGWVTFHSQTGLGSLLRWGQGRW
jgi:hypothetical protein